MGRRSVAATVVAWVAVSEAAAPALPPAALGTRAAAAESTEKRRGGEGGELGRGAGEAATANDNSDDSLYRGIGWICRLTKNMEN